MPEVSFYYQPKAPVGNEFHKIWGQPCEKEECMACQLRLYHYYEGDILHVWSCKVLIMIIYEYILVFFVKRMVIHSDYSLDYLKRLFQDNVGYQYFINRITPIEERVQHG